MAAMSVGRIARDLIAQGVARATAYRWAAAFRDAAGEPGMSMIRAGEARAQG